MNRFTTDNTDGYTAAHLAALNAAFDSIATNEDTADHVAERLLAALDGGYLEAEAARLRGDA